MSSASTALPTVPVYDYAIFLTLTALSLGTGLYLSLRRRGRGISTRDEAFLGSRSLHAIPLAMSMVATNVTAMGTIGWVAYFYQYGFHTYWCIPAFVPAGLLVVCFVLPVLYELRVTSIFEVTTEFDFTTDETVWAAFLGAFPVQLMRVGLDQVIAQRFLAARSLKQARIVALGGVILLAYCYTLHTLTGLAMVYWYRDCDPVLSGSITRYDQIVPYYINKSASSINGFLGLFLAGLVSASIR
ncbi:hypothetical protein HPB52_002434 [Rhipicephalus sanguineus]|uniref:Sodium-dependent multivitamin transporter n=1 Tax=Rhipicephalus sanguineus TaxID=34632 RepID=A0A9D4PBM5_RHISA|nr:hypothetical protein HPB52_002434 [Rhipicephalus sanguineus]